mmetsp:Transcript_27433/g.58683  ORF Transcript_27433/g.58683 Transcript_27433/m.58683 type:complete len:114 (+) Transcript_27433:316-657(+)
MQTHRVHQQLRIRRSMYKTWWKAKNTTDAQALPRYEEYATHTQRNTVANCAAMMGVIMLNVSSVQSIGKYDASCCWYTDSMNPVLVVGGIPCGPTVARHYVLPLIVLFEQMFL